MKTSTGQEVADMLYDFISELGKTSQDIGQDGVGRFYIQGGLNGNVNGRVILPRIYQQYLKDNESLRTRN